MLCLRHCLLRVLLGLVEVTVRPCKLQPQALLESRIVFQAEQTALEVDSEALEGHCQRGHFSWDPSYSIPVDNCVHLLSQTAGAVSHAS